MKDSFLRAICGLALFVLTGCATTRNITVSTVPIDAEIKVNGQSVGRGPVKQQFVFQDEASVNRITVTRLGFRDQTYNLRREYDLQTLRIELRPAGKRFSVQVMPVPGLVSINGRAVSPENVSNAPVEVEFQLDARGNFIPQQITAERPGYVSAAATINYTDPSPTIQLSLEPMRKNLSIITSPPGAQVFLDDEPIGKSPVRDSNRTFPVDSEGRFIPRKLKMTKPGYDPYTVDLSWDEGRVEYHFDIPPHQKVVKLPTDPPGAKVMIDGTELKPGAGGMITVPLTFTPTNEDGELRTYRVFSVKKDGDREWYPKEFVLTWDNGKTDYPIRLNEIRIAPLPRLTASMVRVDRAWDMQAKTIETMAGKQIIDSPDAPPPTQITRELAKGTSLDGFAISPDGKWLLYTVLTTGPDGLLSQIFRVRTDGTGGTDIVTDGKSLDLTPSYSPAGDLIVFSSNRAGKRLSVWSKNIAGGPGITSLTGGETNDLWPCVDSDPKPRLFYQSMIDIRAEPRLFSSPLGSPMKTDLSSVGGMQPRISPRNDAILFTAVNEKTGKRDVYRMADRGSAPENLTNSLDSDDFDPAWNKDGSRVVFASDRAVDEQGRHQSDIYILDLNKSDEPVRVTSNPGVDDEPAFDPAGKAIYFRSNRGGAWGVWKINLP